MRLPADNEYRKDLAILEIERKSVSSPTRNRQFTYGGARKSSGLVFVNFPGQRRRPSPQARSPALTGREPERA